MEMEGLKRRRRSRLGWIMAGVFIILCIVIGLVVWKVTKDSCESTEVRMVVEPKGGTADGAGATTPSPASTTERVYSEEELKAKPWLSLRMRRDVLPVHYDITMYPNFYGDSGVFQGNETIEVDVVRPTRYILVHVHPDYINITHGSVIDKDTGEDLQVEQTFEYRENEFYVIEMEAEIKSTVLVNLQFEGSLVKGIEGIYKSTYLNTVTKERRAIVSSKFEPTFARRAFPCFDEPNIKANYTVTLIHRPDYIALSNMPVDGQSKPVDWSNDLVATKFRTSVKMSTYLVIFTVCDFKHHETLSSRNVPIRVYAAPDKIDQAKVALDVAKTSLDLYEKVFQEDYPLPKQDLIAIPDFVSGAMEHWGLISFRESRMLIDPAKTSSIIEESVAHTVAHEMAHMWFGNLVTMDWWNDLWLNEGFASYMEYLGSAKQYPERDMMTKFLIHDMYRVMDQDSATSSHPIIVDVENPSQITAVFDTISYSKGASVIRMLMSIMGEEHFFNGVASYLKAHKYGNAKTDDLWRALGEADPSHDVKQIMDTWTLQDGFPYISVELDTDQTTGLTTVTANQSRFLLNRDTVLDSTKSPFGYKWYVQLDYKTRNGTEGSTLMNMTNTSFTSNLGLNNADGWVKFNRDQTQFYRVLYPGTMWTALSDYLKTTDAANWELSTADRAGLLSDAFKLASAGLVPYRVPLGLMAYLGREPDYVPWRVAETEGLAYISAMLYDDPDYALWKNFLKRQLNPVAQKLGFNDEGTPLERQLRALVSRQACAVEIADTVANVTRAFREWMDEPTSAPPVNFRGLVYSYGMAEVGTEEDWEEVWNRYLVEPSPTEKSLLASSLAATKKRHLIARLLEKAKAEDGIKRQDFFTTIQRIGFNKAAAGMLWDWTRENYQFLVDRFTISSRYFGRMVYYMVRDYNTQFKLKEVQELFQAFPQAGAGERYRRMAVESIQTNIDWMKNYKPQVLDWLRAQKTN